MVPGNVATSATLAAAASLCTSTLYMPGAVINLPGQSLPVTLAEPLVQQTPCRAALARRAQAPDMNGAGAATPQPSPSALVDAKASDIVNVADAAVASVTTTPSASTAAATSTPGGGNVTLSNTILNAPTSTATASATLNFHSGGASSKTVHISSFGDPFYLSTSPIIYALAATTIVSYMLVIALFITTRSFFDGGIVYLGSRGSFTGRSSSGGVSIGGRPWLQKIAALTVAISLTIATADTMSIVKEQYGWGVTNAPELQREVMSRLELKVIRIISDTFLWLAQAQTLIRLFPRHREKVVIKWVAFALISLDVVFSSLNSFPFAEYDILSRGPANHANDGSPSNKGLAHPVPAISYVFKLSLGLLYFIWVSYYAFLKRRYAFYHPLMKNICLVAVISLLSITVPIVFFILDISKPNFTAWGDYVRWVGAAAASVVVWEWVERIEALEREEKKDGVLGREVYDGDDMLEINAAEYPWRNKHGKFGGSGNSSGHGGDLEGGHGHHHRHNGHTWSSRGGTTLQNGHSFGHEPEPEGMVEHRRAPIWSQRVAQAVTPISRTETPSAASTVYAVRYQSESRTPEPSALNYLHHAPELTRQPSATQNYSEDGHEVQSHNGRDGITRSSPDASGDAPGEHHLNNHIRDAGSQQAAPASSRAMRSVSYSNEPGTQDSSEEVRRQRQHSIATRSSVSSLAHGSRSGRSGRWDIRGRFEDFAASQADRLRERFHPSTDTDKLPVTIVPAPARVGAALQQVLEEEEEVSEGRRQQQQQQQEQEQQQQQQHPPPGGRRLSRGNSGSLYGSGSAIDAAASTASERYTALGGPARTIAGTTSQGGGGNRPSLLPLPVNNPPLWPGVNRRATATTHGDDEDDDDGSFDGDEGDDDEGLSMTDDLSSVVSRERPNGPSRS